mmetsp:Transcript_2956/g.7034  ORF Transcript_2956/g.7034 Transcript_2956/m.7034 type:complete len:222 (+) Transcript_2956:402-1067(+)
MSSPTVKPSVVLLYGYRHWYRAYASASASLLTCRGTVSTSVSSWSSFQDSLREIFTLPGDGFFRIPPTESSASTASAAIASNSLSMRSWRSFVSSFPAAVISTPFARASFTMARRFMPAYLASACARAPSPTAPAGAAAAAAASACGASSAAPRDHPADINEPSDRTPSSSCTGHPGAFESGMSVALKNSITSASDEDPMPFGYASKAPTITCPLLSILIL